MPGRCAGSTQSNANNIAPLELKASGDDFSYALRLDADQPLVLQGDAGYSRKSLREQASYYYSQPHFSVKGRITIDDKPVDVTGQAWLDREWSSQPLASDQTGWDWLSLHFNAGEKLMLYRMRQTDGNHYGSGNWIPPDGNTEQLASADISLTPQALPRSPAARSRRLAHRDSRACADDRLRAAEHEELDGNEFSLLGRPDQLCRQPQRIRLSGDDGILAASFHAIALCPAFTSLLSRLDAID